MGDKSAIQWTKSNLRVVSRDIAAGPTPLIKSAKMLITATSTGDHRIALAWFYSVKAYRSVFDRMMGARSKHLKILDAIVGSVTVAMVYLFPVFEWPADSKFGYDTVLVNVAPNVSKPVTGFSHKNISVRGDRFTAFPVRVSFTCIDFTHTLRVTQGC